MNIILPTASNKNIEIGTWNVPSYHTYLARYSSHVVISKLGRLENYLKSSRNKKDLNYVTAARFSVSFSQLPAAKKHQKAGSCEAI